MDRIDTLVEHMPDDFMPSLDADSASTLVLASARETPFDAGGRIVLPEDFIAHARLTDQGAFVGRGKRFQIWKPEALKATLDDLARRAAAKRREELAGGTGQPK